MARKGHVEMSSHRASDFQKVLENVVFIAEVFGNRPEQEIPDVPFLDLARSFELKGLRARGPSPNRNKGAGL